MTHPYDARPVFLALPPHECDPRRSRYAVLPVPYDGTSTWMKGADRGPAALIDASGTVEFHDIPTNAEPCRAGICTLDAVACAGLSPEAMTERVHRAVAGVLDAKQVPIVLGGEHSVSIGAIAAVADRHPGVGVLQIDAHGDTRESYEGSSHNHACIMARARERCPIVQVGIRAIDETERPKLDPKRVFWGHAVCGNPDRSWMDRAIELLPEEVYLTIDLDGFDPASCPATGTPEPGGFSWSEVNDLVRRLAQRRRIVGFDVVELLPMEGHHASAFLAAKLVYRIIAEMEAARGTAG